MAYKCKHTKCAVCGGFKLETRYMGRIGGRLSDFCSPKCQTATKDVCTCKCAGEFHKGQNSNLLNFLIDTSGITTSKSKTKVNKKLSFEPQTISDYIAIFLQGKRIKTTSFDRYSDKNLRKDNKKINLFWLSKTGQPLDQLANDFISEYGFNQYSEADVIYLMVNYINDYPSGIKKYIEDVESDRIRQESYYSNLPEDLLVSGIKNKKMKSKKKPSPAQLAARAKFVKMVRAKAAAKKASAKKTIGKKAAKKSAPKKAAKKAAPKKATAKHIDTKSHNVNIRVVSGIGSLTSKAKDILKDKYGKLATKKLVEKTKRGKKSIQKEMTAIAAKIRKIQSI